MRYLLLVFIVLAADRCLGQSTQPATQPAQSVLLLPFEALNGRADVAWIGPAVQKTLVSQLAKQGVRSIRAAELATGDITTAKQAAQRAGTRYVLFGSYQIYQMDIRLTGQVLDTLTDELIGGLSVDGDLRNLFAMQDGLAQQAANILSRTPLIERPKMPAQTETQVAQVDQPFEGSALERSLQAGPTGSRNDQVTFNYYYQTPPGYWYERNCYWGYGRYYYGGGCYYPTPYYGSAYPYHRYYGGW